MTEEQQNRWIVAEIEATWCISDGWLSRPLADTPASTDMSRYGGMARADMTPKPWAQSFGKYAGLAGLPQSTPTLPSFDVTVPLTAAAADLEPMHDGYSPSVQEALRGAQ